MLNAVLFLKCVERGVSGVVFWDVKRRCSLEGGREGDKRDEGGVEKENEGEEKAATKDEGGKGEGRKEISKKRDKEEMG